MSDQGAPRRSSLHAALHDALGDGLQIVEPAVQVAGCRLGLRVEPRDGEALSRVLRALDAAHAPAVIRSGGSRMGLGNPARDARVLLSCVGLSGIDELDAADGVVRAGAGTPLSELAGAAEAQGWQVPLDPPGAGSTLGGALATAARGPRALGFGPARDCVLGLDTVLASGARTRWGGRVVKNVTGYDLAKLYVGSLGTLGVLERVWLRLRPMPRASMTLTLALEDPADAQALALATARHSAARAVALLSPELVAQRPAGLPVHAGRWLLVAEFAGDEAAAHEGAHRLATGRATDDADGHAIVARLRDLQGHVAPLGVRARLHLRPSRLVPCCEALRGAGAAVLVHPLPGVVYAYFEPGGHSEDDPWWLDGVLAALERARARQQAEVVIEELPQWCRGRRDVFYGGSGPLSLMRRIKARFDPNGILNPGRFVGSI
jgi:glycolate oxidase FAD binding subunit